MGVESIDSCVSDFCIVKSSEKALSTSTQNLFFFCPF